MKLESELECMSQDVMLFSLGKKHIKHEEYLIVPEFILFVCLLLLALRDK